MTTMIYINKQQKNAKLNEPVYEKRNGLLFIKRPKVLLDNGALHNHSPLVAYIRRLNPFPLFFV